MPLVTSALLNGVWRKIGQIGPSDPPGSLTDSSDNKREIYSFKCYGDYSVISRSAGGFDYKVGGVGRMISSFGLIPVSTLRAGESYEKHIKSDRLPESVLIRFTHE